MEFRLTFESLRCFRQDLFVAVTETHSNWDLAEKVDRSIIRKIQLAEYEDIKVLPNGMVS